MMKTEPRGSWKFKKNPDKMVLKEIQDIYIKNFIIYYKQSRAHIKQVVKNCYRVADLFEKVEREDLEFTSKFLRRAIQDFEDDCLENNYPNHVRVRYEDVQVIIHNNLKSCKAGHCFEHGINLHYCDKCKENFGLSEDGDE